MCDGIVAETQETEERLIWKIVEWHRCVYLDVGICVYYLEVTTVKDLESIIRFKLSCDELWCVGVLPEASTSRNCGHRF